MMVHFMNTDLDISLILASVSLSESCQLQYATSFLLTSVLNWLKVQKLDSKKYNLL